MRAFDKYFKDELALEEIKKIIINYSHYPIGSRKLVFTSNHNENTYNGTEYENYGIAAKAMAIFTCTWPGIPLIYSGQEKPNYKRLAFFEKDFIDWEGNIELNDSYKTLLSLRKRNKALLETASVLILKTFNEHVLAYLCSRQTDPVLVLLNLGKEDADFAIDHASVHGMYHDLFTNEIKEIHRNENFYFKPGQLSVYHITGTAVNVI